MKLVKFKSYPMIYTHKSLYLFKQHASEGALLENPKKKKKKQKYIGKGAQQNR